MSEQPKVSVILPSLNVKDYITDCLTSVISQTLTDIEIICVDAGSTDGTFEILKEFEKQDPRITVIESPEKSYGYQMNLGIDKANGKYIGILETDDIVPPNMYEDLYKICEKNDLDFVKADFYRFTVLENGDLRKKLFKLSEDTNLYNKVIDPSEQTECFTFVMNTWSGIYRTDFLRENNIRHNETPGASYQDNGFWFQTLCRGKRAMFLDTPYYLNRRDNPNSSVYSTSKIYAMRDEYDFVREIIENDKEELERFIALCAYYRFNGYYHNTINRISPELRPEFLEYFGSEYRTLADANEIDPSLFYPKELRALYRIMYLPKEYLAISMRKTFHFRIKEAYLNFQPITNDGPMVSVVIPVYNVEKYIAECLDTLLAQTMPDFEVICVNDGSTDSSLSILEQYSKRDSRINVLDIPNGGPSNARNQGLSKATGRYVLFVDSDDGLAVDALEKLVSKAEKTGSDIVVFGIDTKHFPLDGEAPAWIENKNPKRNILIRSPKPRLVLIETGTKPFAVRDFLRRSFLVDNDLWFPTTFSLGEDTIFQFEIFPAADTVTFITDKLYYYRIFREGSSMMNAKAAIVDKTSCHARIISHIAAVWKCAEYLGKTRFKFTEWAIDFFYAQFNHCPEDAKPKLANDFIPILSGFITDQVKDRLSAKRLGRIKELEEYRRKYNPLKVAHTEVARIQEDREDASNPVFSFVVPVHNSEKTLNATLDSLLMQTYGNLEVICINDCSTDGSLEILHERAEKDARLKIISYENNMTANQARIDGVLAAQGSHILFCDADDTYALDACEKLLAYTGDDNAQIINFETEVINESADANDVLWVETHSIPYYGILKGSDVFDACFRGEIYSFSLWNKMFKASLAKKAFGALKEGRLPRGQDLYAFVALAYFAESYQGIPNSRFYQYHMGAGMDGKQHLTPDQFRSFIKLSDISKSIDEFLESQGAFPYYTDVSLSLSKQLIGDCINKWVHKVSDKDKGALLDEMCEQWPIWQVVATISRQYSASPSEIARWWNGSPRLTKRLSDLKTIGMYYHKQAGGGVETVIRRLTSLFKSMGYKIVIINDIQGPSDKIPLDEDVTHRHIPNFFEVTSKNYEARGKALSDIIEEEKIDLMIYHAWNAYLITWDMLVTKLSGANFLVHTHGIFSLRVLDGRTYFKDQPKVLGLADGLICLSNVNKAFWSIFNSNTFALPNPIDLGKYSHGTSNLENENIIWVGRLESEKHPEEALKVFRNVLTRTPNAKLKVLGTAPTSEKMQEFVDLAEELAISDSVEFCGFVEDVSPYYLNASLFLCTSECEGYPMALLDALIYGVPVAMYDLPYLSLVENNEAIISSHFGDDKDLAGRISRLFASKETLKEVGRKAREFADNLSNFDFAQAWNEVFESLKKAKPAPKTSEAERIMWDTLLEHYMIGLKKAQDAAIEETIEKYHIKDSENNLSKHPLKNKKKKTGRASNKHKIRRYISSAMKKTKRAIKKFK